MFHIFALVDRDYIPTPREGHPSPFARRPASFVFVAAADFRGHLCPVGGWSLGSDITVPPSPVFFVSVASKEFSVPVNSLESTLASIAISVVSKGVRRKHNAAPFEGDTQASGSWSGAPDARFFRVACNVMCVVVGSVTRSCLINSSDRRRSASSGAKAQFFPELNVGAKAPTPKSI